MNKQKIIAALQEAIDELQKEDTVDKRKEAQNIIDRANPPIDQDKMDKIIAEINQEKYQKKSLPENPKWTLDYQKV